MKIRLPHLCRALASSQSGAAAIMWALLMPIVFGGVALCVDVGIWYHAKRNLQNATDAAAVATAYKVSGATTVTSTLQPTATSEMQRNGFGSTTGVTVTVTYPPGSGAYAGNNMAVEVVSQQTQHRYFSQFFMGSNPDVRVRAVGVRQASGSACILALNQSASQGLYFQGSTVVNLNNCTGASNSTASDAINVSGSATVNAYSLYTAGGYYSNGSPTLTTTQATVTYGTPITDPYSNLTMPTVGTCDHNNYSASGTSTITAGVYCNGLTFAANSTTTMASGTYIIDRGTFKVNNNATVTSAAGGVTIILTSRTGASGSYATVRINGGSTVNLTASTSGPYAGMLFFQDPNAFPDTNLFNGGATMGLTGAIYIPKQEVQFSGNNNTTTGYCTKIVADTVTFIGNSSFTNNCPGSVADITTQGLVQIVE